MPPSCGNVNGLAQTCGWGPQGTCSGRHYPLNLFHQFAQVEGLGQDLGALGLDRSIGQGDPGKPRDEDDLHGRVEFCAPAG